jgi:hypothetical protein
MDLSRGLGDVYKRQPVSKIAQDKESSGPSFRKQASSSSKKYESNMMNVLTHLS